MATLIKEEEGILYNEYFHENPLIWSLTPSETDCLRYGEDGLRILHTNQYVTYMLQEPESRGYDKGKECYCLIMHLDHTPITEEDIAGLIVMSDTNNYAEFQTYLATSPSTIGNNGENVNAGYDLGAHYVSYRFDDEEDESHEGGSSSSDEETIVNPSTGFVDTIYKILKVIKYDNAIGYTYQFFASSDGFNWIEVGNFDTTRRNSIGFFLYGTKDARTLQRGKFIIHEFALYKNRYITINGINILQEFEIFDRRLNKTILRSDDTLHGQLMVSHHGNRVQIDTTHMVLPLTDAWIRIYTKGHYNDTVAQFDMDNLTFGGDIFTISYDIQLRIDNEIVPNGEPYDLGTLFTDTFRKNIVIYNNENIDLANITVSITAFSEYYNGEEVVQLAFYKENMEYQSVPPYTYKQSLMIPKLEAHTGVELVMKLSDVPKQEFYSVANKYRFKLIIE